MPPYHQADGGGGDVLGTETLSAIGAEPIGKESVSSTAGRTSRSVSARAMVDVLLAGVSILLLTPLLLVIAVAVRLSSSGPALFRQERVGLDGKRFQIYKFRTMVVDADHQLQALLERHNRGDQPLFKVPDDPRITRLGQFLRKTSLDELPQLFNVLRAEMALVGPRPQRPSEVALYSPREFGRLAVRPGITGLWQVNGRSDLPWEQAVELDLHYVQRRSLRMDIAILLKTVVVVFSRRGAE